MFIVSISYKVDLSEVDKLLDEHIAYLDKHYQAGHFMASGRKVPRTGGVILASVENREKMELILEEDPFFKADLADYEVEEFIPSKLADGFECLKNT